MFTTQLIDSILFECVDKALLEDVATTQAIINAKAMIRGLSYSSLSNLSEAIFDQDIDTAKSILSSVGL